MRRGSTLLRSNALISCQSLVLFLATCSAQPSLKLLHTFGAPGDGFHPFGALAFDKSGNLYGTTSEGPGTACSHYGCGVVYELSPNADGTWSEKLVHNFDGTDGSYPVAGVLFDVTGNLYGTTTCAYGGCNGNRGTQFRISPSQGDDWNLATLHFFRGGDDGDSPVARVAFDPLGRVFGTTEYGGKYGNGVVYTSAPVSPFKWYELIAHVFTGGSDGGGPYSGLVFDKTGAGYGVGYSGGLKNVGTVFKLTPNKLSFGWTETVLYSFTGVLGGGKSSDGAGPWGPIALDSDGNLWGTTIAGGTGGFGTVFKLTHNPDDSWTESVLHAFQGPDGANPSAGVTFDGAGNLYGTTSSGGDQGYGTVYILTPSNGQWTETVLHSFTYYDGAAPYSGVVFDSAGNLYGTAVSGGTYGPNGGVVYEITP